MRINQIMLFVIVFLFWEHQSFSQTTARLTLTERSASLDKVLRDIEVMTGYTYMIDLEGLSKARKVSFSVRDVPLKEVLDSCMRDQPLYLVMIGRSINIYEGADVAGEVVDEEGKGIAAATVGIKGNYFTWSGMTGEGGRFRVHVPVWELRMEVSCIGYEPGEYSIRGGRGMRITLRSRVNELSGVVVHNGFEDIPQERATGSFGKVRREEVGRRVSPSVVERLDGVTGSLLVNKNVVAGSNQSTMTIRGRSTIFSNPEPLIVIDNFPYNGDLNSINPEDIESVSVLKDAAAASVWGTRAANGVLVLKTRQGKYGQVPRVSFSTSVMAGWKPDLYYQPVLSSSDFIDVETYLFNQGYYDGQLMSGAHPVVSPVVEVLAGQRQGQLSAHEATAQLDALRKQDVRRDLSKYYYRGSLNQQYWMGVSGGSGSNRYALSVGVDKNLSGLVRNGYERITALGNNTYMVVPKKLEVDLGVAYTGSTLNNSNSGGINANYPYLRLADGQGHALVVPYHLRTSYADTAGGGRLLDWHYRPLDELRSADNVTRGTDYRLSTGLHYTLSRDWKVQALYRYSRGESDGREVQGLGSYYTRNLINEFTQVDAGGQLNRIIPMGGILDELDNTYQSHNGRLQVNYDHMTGDQEWHVLGGAEVQATASRIRTSRVYGYDPQSQSGLPVSSYTTLYPQYSFPLSLDKIPYLDNEVSGADHYLSYYANGSYRYHGRYIVTASGRLDQSNLFGVNANGKRVPLWSAGVAWELSREEFYKLDWLPFLKVRLTHGYNGNSYKSVSGYTTASGTNTSISNVIGIGSGFINTYGAPYADIINPPNPNLRWEQVRVINAGVDFSSKHEGVEGSVEYYSKDGRDLIGAAAVDPTSGNTQYVGNTANMVAHGVDINLRTRVSIGAVSWQTALLFNYVRDKVTHYLVSPQTIQYFFSLVAINPVAGRPLYSVYALPWAGLDPQTGDPQGWVGGHISKDYATLIGTTDLSSLRYKGPVSPPFFGSWRNSVSWKRWGLSWTLTYKCGHYFRRPSIQYFALFTGSSQGHPDYRLRWQHPGDEVRTYVPSMSYPASSTRDDFYRASEVLIEKGDYIRLQDIQLYYDWPGKKTLKALRLYVYGNNIGLLWKANHQGIDPDAVMGMPDVRMLAAGIKLEL